MAGCLVLTIPYKTICKSTSAVQQTCVVQDVQEIGETLPKKLDEITFIEDRTLGKVGKVLYVLYWTNDEEEENIRQLS